MNDCDPVELARRHWRFLAPTWLMPVVIMLVVVAQDITGTQFSAHRWLPFVAIPVMLVATLAAVHLQRREHLPWPVFYLIWLAPMMAIWCALVLVRAAILIPLGRPL
jgi:hypothetical protein